jgi:hypothetical protein
MKPWFLAAAAVAAATAAPAALAGGAHQHGTAQLDIAVEPQRITFTFDSPLDNVVGFERAPRTDAERERARVALARLRDAAALFRIDGSAGCTPIRAEVLAPLLEPAAGAAPAAATAPAAKPPAKDGHADLQAYYEFSCQAGARAGFVELGLFDAFAGLRRVDLQVVTPRGQLKARLVRPASRVALVR